MAAIKVNSTTMKDKANLLKNNATSIKGFTEEMTAEMDKLKGLWEGDVAETTVTKFKALKSSFEDIFKTINDYADFLNKAAEEWDKVNSANLNAANNIQ